uniref:SMODS and SLOG-associating 2TM effector domain-containing protein n=1 Tax=Eucampia antarctica TaxID=49252 RepID=A0A7S2WJ94_9STRA|mmetsp:Transcript_3162/g.3031  ORF Transcript_3162/g.3031 Transcript_3162/m.3031 type:complete len:790 (+) Transcript_3162:38-2407(+)|eukprot:CAMPEP_0197826124 /NCGR_PEP_ID=MMETSP1437-20131217/3113_1 /TAXON_ID=49252 ORGANISM="Eucampia antarctica, Strain CCMP1452" /NCGR_SAMPLE_ID=MMETSP1437 /ASSEMBLY_ACC=CAM_ASM_001096 /LENGTH=789 /DNA_ID=CAMNT_0043426409 /DNA_START=38 /DNA_END=2407 /DNA_ORIENTATION=-
MAEEIVVYDNEDVSHAADFDTPLHQGILRYVPGDSVPIQVRNALPAKNDRPFIYVPMGYLTREADKFMTNILGALNLTLPNLILVTAESQGSAEEQQMNSYRVQDPSSHPVAKDWPHDHTREVLEAKVGRFLESIIESCLEVGAWVLPDVPRRRNGAAQMICNAIPSVSNGVALGLMGLNEEEDDVEFKKSIQSSMVPLGSPIKNVAKVVYDLDLKDGAPCPDLSHLLIFESPQEKKKFRDQLLDLVPDILLAFGDITKEAMHSVFENTKAGSPIIMLKHTSTNVDSLCRMFRHVKSSMKTEALSALGSSKNQEDDSKVKIPPINDEEDELIRLFINTWPPGFNTESVVLADPLMMSAVTLQKRILGSITATFDLKTGGSDSRLQRRKIMTYAWYFYNLANQHSKEKKKGTEKLHVQLVAFTLVSIVASVLYDKVYSGGTPDNNFQLFIFVATIILPLYITSLKQESDKGTEMMSWKAFKVAAVNIHSEIFKFRAQVGPYRVDGKSQIALQRPILRFSVKLKEMWMGVKPYLSEDGMEIPPNFWDFDPNSILKEDSSPTSLPAMEDKSFFKNFMEVNFFSHRNDNAADETTPMLDGPVDETTPIHIKLPAYGKSSSNESPFMSAEPSSVVNTPDDRDDEDPPEQIFVDDNFSPMKADDYIESRMQKQMNQKAEIINKMVSRNSTLSFTIKLVTLFSGASAALSLQWCVPIILGITASLGTGQEFRKYPKRIELGNAMVVQLNELKLWWMGLSMYQKQLPQNKDNLIMTAERLLMKELESSYDIPSIEKD